MALNMTTVEEAAINIDMAKDEEIDLSTKEGRLKWARIRAGFKSARAAGMAMGLKQSTYPAHENGQNQFDEKSAKLYGKTFNVSWIWLLHGTGNPEPSADDLALYGSMPDSEPETPKKPNVSFPPQHQRLGSDRAIPVMGQTVGGSNGRFVLNGQRVGSVFCPPDLLSVDDAYAVRVYGTSMEPRYKPGETVWLNPLEPVRSGDDVVVQVIVSDDEAPDSYLKEFVSQSSKVVRLLQLNPDEGEDEILEFPADRVFSIHKVVFHAKA